MPEALSRFYVTREGERVGQRVGASWMTREDREAEVADIVRYLDDVFVAACARADADPRAVRLGAVGFSQGTATVTRWLAYSPLVAARARRGGGGSSCGAGALPHDLDLGEHAGWLGAADLRLVAGDRDEFATPGRVLKGERRLEDAGIAYDATSFSGGHRLDDRLLAEAMGAARRVTRPAPPPVGRFAPSPTGDLHVGSALAALAAWTSVRGRGGERGGRFVWRVEDLDGPRAVPGAAERQMEDARWLGLDWGRGAGPRIGVRGRLWRSARAVPAVGAGRALRGGARAPGPGGAALPVPALAERPPRPRERPPTTAPASRRTRPDSAPPRSRTAGWTTPGRPPTPPSASRVDPGVVVFDDRVAGRVEEDVAATTGRRRLEAPGTASTPTSSPSSWTTSRWA